MHDNEHDETSAALLRAARIRQRVRWETFAGRSRPFLSCFDLAVFKAFFNRTKGWADLEEMQAADTLDEARVRVTLIRHLGADDERSRAWVSCCADSQPAVG